MKKFVAMIAAAVVSSLLLVLPAAPASADTGVCAGTGNATTGVPLWAPLAGPKANHTNFAFGTNVGGCVTTGPGQKALVAAGTVNGYCGLASGSGTAFGDGTDPEFWFIGIGPLLITAGHITGVAVALPDVAVGESCVQGGADLFIIAGLVLKSHDIFPQTKPTDPDKFPPELPNLRAIICTETGGAVCP